MKTIKTYQIDELPENIQKKIIDEFRGINVEYWEWSHAIEEIINNAGFILISFDLDRKEIELIPNYDFHSSALIIVNNKEEHSEEFVKISENFCSEWSKLVNKYSDGIQLDKVSEENGYEFDREANELEKEYLQEISGEALLMLQREFDWLCSDETIFDTIRANEYEFTKGGQFIHHSKEA